MSLKTTYKEYILERLFLDYLYRGVIPTTDQLEADLAAYQESHADLEQPASKTADFSIEYGGYSSSSKIQSIADTISEDVSVVTRDIYRVAEDSSKMYERWLNEFKRLAARARKLQQRVDSLLLLKDNSAGFFAWVADTFSDMNQVDMNLTTARINTHDGTVTLNPFREEPIDSSGSSLIDLSGMNENDVSFSVVSKKPGTASTPTNTNNAPFRLFKSDSSHWVSTVSSKTNGEMVCELRAKLSSKDLDVSQISMLWTGPVDSKTTCTVMYSTNGYSWALIPTADATKVITRNISWGFPVTKMRNLKFIFRKESADKTDNSYIFSAEYIKIYGHTFRSATGNLLYSKSLESVDPEGTTRQFSSVALDVCQKIPTSSGISFFVAASKDNLTWTSWYQINHSAATEISYPKIINFSGIDWTTNLDTPDDELVNQSYSSLQLVSNLENEDHELLGYKFKDGSFRMVNTLIHILDPAMQDTIASNVTVWRNFLLKDDEVYTVRNTPRGWGFNGGTYSCYFEIINSDGATMDFGPNKCTLDSKEVSGAVKITSGVHKFSTSSNNWFDFSSLVLGTETEESELKALDPLYPYNHKYVVEGFVYSGSFAGEKKYTGANTIAEFYGNRVSLFELENNSTSMADFAVRGIGSENYPALVVITTSDPSYGDYENELCLVKWKSSSDTSLYKYVKLKAEFWTEDGGVTPVLEDYRIKLGL